MIQIWTVETFLTLGDEQMNLKPSMNINLQAGSTGDTLDADSTGDSRILLVGGILDKKASSKSIVKSKLAVHEGWWERIRC